MQFFKDMNKKYLDCTLEKWASIYVGIKPIFLNLGSLLNSNYDVKVTSTSADPHTPVVVVTSIFPYFLQTISDIQKGKLANSLF